MRSIVLQVAHEPHIQTFITKGPGRALAERFIAGETLDQAIAATESLGARGFRVSLDYLGEAVESLDEAVAAADVYRDMIQRLRGRDTPISLSLKPSQFGVDRSPAGALELLAPIVRNAASIPAGVRLDMEDSSHTDTTLWLWRALAERGLPVGVVLQAALYRTPTDLAVVLTSNASVRLCKGAYAEPATIAYPRKADVDEAYSQLLTTLLQHAASVPPEPGYLPTAAIATHDERLIRRALDEIHRLNVDPRNYEFQMLYGVRRDLQDHLLALGVPVRIYTPWGPAWYPYLMRRLAERPANVLFMASALVTEATRPHRQPADRIKTPSARR